MALTGIFCLVLACSTKYRLSEEDLSYPSPWPFHHGDLTAQGSIRGGSFNGKLEVLWEQEESDKPAGPLSIYYGTLIYPGAKNRMKFFDVFTGEYYGFLKSGGTAQTGVVVHDSLACFATSPYQSWLRCINLRTGKLVWKQPIKDATGGSIIVEDNLVVSTTDGALASYRLEDGHQLWVLETDGGCSAPPAYSDGRIFQPCDKGILYAVSAKDGSELYRVEVDDPMIGPVAVSSLIVATDMNGKVYAIEPSDGSIMWETPLEGPVWTTPAVADGRVFVGHSGGELVALDKNTGQVLWQLETNEVIKASPIVIGDYVIVGTMTGKVFSLNTADGEVVDHRQLEGAVAHSPVTDGERVYIATESGKIVCMGWTDEHTTSTNR
jgi:outer membrane protein assembly factor BamB